MDEPATMEVTVKRNGTLSHWYSSDSARPFVPHLEAARIASIQSTDPQTLVLTADQTTSIHVDQVGNATEPTLLRVLGLTEYDQRPAQYSPGQPIGPIAMPTDHYVANVTHVAIWPDGVAAQDFYGAAPRLTRLSYYLRRQFNTGVAFEAMYDPSILDPLHDIRGQMRSVDIALTRPSASLDRGVFGTLVPAVLGSRAPSISVRLGMGRHGSRTRYLDEELQEDVLSLAENASELVDRMVISGRSRTTGRTVNINMVNEKLGEPIDIMPERSGSSIPDADDAYQQLKGVRDRLASAGSLESAVTAHAVRP